MYAMVFPPFLSLLLLIGLASAARARVLNHLLDVCARPCAPSLGTSFLLSCIFLLV